jgi:hypothetical protein
MAEALPKTRDARVATILKAGLDDRRVVVEEVGLGGRLVIGPTMPPPQRVCDFALEGLLTLWDATPDDAYGEVLRARGIEDPVEPKEAMKIRDAMIVDVKRRLEEYEKKAGR